MADDIFVDIVEEAIESVDGGALPLPPLFLALTADRELTFADDMARLTNEGATAPIAVTLPPSSTISRGWSVKLRVVEALALRVACDGDDVVRYEASELPYLESAAPGSTIELELVAAGVFFVTSHPIGPWEGPEPT